MAGAGAAGLLVPAARGPALALGICALTVPNRHTATVLLQEAVRAAAARLAGLAVLTREPLLEI